MQKLEEGTTVVTVRLYASDHEFILDTAGHRGVSEFVRDAVRDYITQLSK